MKVLEYGSDVAWKDLTPSLWYAENVEVFGTSWMFDLMAAQNNAATSLKGRVKLVFNGATDANYGATLPHQKMVDGVLKQFGHFSHDLGMAMDIKLTQNINPTFIKKKDTLLAEIKALPNVEWSIANAVAYSKDLPDTLTPATPLIPATKEVPATATTPMIPAKKAVAAKSETGENDQVSAIRDILSMYATVRKDGEGNNAVDGSWGKLKLFSDAENTAKQNLIRTALFGDGTADKALIARVLTGKNEVGKSEYVNMHAVFDKLGIKSGFDNSDHFHMYLRPPKPMAIGGVIVGNLTLGGDALPITSTNHPVLESNLQPLIDYSQLLTSLGDEMFIYLDVPYLPLPNLPIITLQDQSDKTKKGNEASSKIKQKFNYLFKDCQEFEDTIAEGSAEHVLIPALSLTNYFEQASNYKREFDYRNIKTSILQEPKHGELIENINSKGSINYTYYPEPGYLGKDSAVFVAEFNGKRYKITTELRVVRPHAGESNCPPNRLIKVGQFTPTPNDYKVTFSDLTGSAVGETKGEGLNAQITLDTNAAGHGWYIDDTPDNNDEFLPTTDPEVWVAKAGTAAAGKMDMLSVLLHEYGHALGIEHSGDNADYMAASLQPGQRRLPSTEELSLMARLVAALKGGTDDPSDPMNPNLPLSSLGLMALCRIRRADYGWTLGVDKAQLVSRVDVNNLLQNANQPAQLQTVVNSTLNQDSNAWQTTGNIGNTDGNITLAESTTSNTHLSQSFAVKQSEYQGQVFPQQF